MNQQKDSSFESIMEALISEGPEMFRSVLEQLFNKALVI